MKTSATALMHATIIDAIATPAPAPMRCEKCEICASEITTDIKMSNAENATREQRAAFQRIGMDVAENGIDAGTIRYTMSTGFDGSLTCPISG